MALVRATRAMGGTSTIVSAMSTFTRPGPSAPVMAMARKMLGNAKDTSRVRMITRPAAPPK